MDTRFDLRGVVSVVTGASRGAGRGIAQVLGEAGATVYCGAVELRARVRLAAMELGMPGGLRATSVLVRRTRAARPPAWRRSAARARTTAGAANCGRSDLRTAHHELLRGLPREPDAASARRPRLHTPPRRCDLRDLRQRFCHRESHVDPCRRHRTGSLTDARANFMAAALL